jgi:hypothetical protein
MQAARGWLAIVLPLAPLAYAACTGISRPEWPTFAATPILAGEEGGTPWPISSL